MELETEDQTIIDYNDFFCATVCHVCKRFGDDVPLKRCSGCKMIAYCGKEHQKQHWAQHKPLCKAIRDVLKDGLEDTTPDNWSNMKQRLLDTVKKKKESLEYYEIQMLLYPKECAVCHGQNVESLVDCRNCAVSFCEDHKDSIAHWNACEPLKLYFHLCLSAMKKLKFNFDQYLRHKCTLENGSNTDTETSNAFQDMNGFINSRWNTEKIEESHSEMYKCMLAAKLSEYLTRSMTVLYGMEVLNFVPKHKELVIHVVAAGDEEEIMLSQWENMLHQCCTETDGVSLVIIMIGKLLKSESHSLSICDDCLLRRRKVSVEFHTVLYEDYVRSPLFVKPDLIVEFNVDILRESYVSQLVQEMTELSIQMIAKQNCPLLLTCRSQETLEKYTNNINSILNRTVDYLYSGKNPFAGLRPFRYLGPKLIFYNNSFIAIYRSLCP